MGRLEKFPMKRLLAFIYLATVSHALAFMPNPDLLVISPAVGKAGSTVEVTISGKELDEAETLRFSDGRIKAEPVMLPVDEFHPEPRPVESKFTVTIPADVEPGVYEVRSRGYFGLSTGRPFLVVPADRNHATEEGDHSTPETAQSLEVEAGILGTIDRSKLDYYKFSAKKGERILVQAFAERLDSKSDLLLAVTDAEGRELGSSRQHFGRDPFVDLTAPADGDYFVAASDVLYNGGKEYFYYLRASAGPHIDFVFPPAGLPGTKAEFTVFGRNLPGGSPGEGWTLNEKPLETVEKTIDVPKEIGTPDTYHWDFPRRGVLPSFEYSIDKSDPVRIGFATAPVVEEDTESEFQTVKIPAEIAGRFDEAGDADFFHISAKKGETYWIEVISHRLGATTDPFVAVEKIGKDKDGAETFETVVDNDDQPSFFGKDYFDDLNADSLDPALSFTAEEDGDYRVSLFNQSAGGSAAHLYRLAICKAQPDFQLLVGHELTKTINNDAFPAAPLLRKGGSMIYRVIALRQDGFDGDITVNLTAGDLPKGLTAEPLVLSGKTRQGFLTVWADPAAPDWSGPVELVGKARVNGKEVSRSAHPASIIWGKRVFARASQVRSRLDMETVLSSISTETEPVRMVPVEDKTWEVEIGETLEIPITLKETGTRVGNLQVNVHGFPGLHRSPPTVAIPESAKEAILKFPFTPSANFELEPGTYQFVLQGVGNRKYARNPAAVERTAAELARLKSLEKPHDEKLVAIKADIESRQKELTAARQAEAGAADDAARESLKNATAAAQKKLDEANEAMSNHSKQKQQLALSIAAADKAAKAAKATAVEKTNQFATYSQPITVVVKAKPEKK